MTDKNIPLSAVPAALLKHGVAVPYHRVWSAVIAGAIPHERVGQRIRINCDDLPALAEAIQPGATRAQSVQ